MTVVVGVAALALLLVMCGAGGEHREASRARTAPGGAIATGRR
ncbi:hypothetical protein [Streptomyces noursei]|nr:hypothetical protein [Streptomyces noursei]MCZ1014920.1 hypothetical protein [Streptomyces noursei]